MAAGISYLEKSLELSCYCDMHATWNGLLWPLEPSSLNLQEIEIPLKNIDTVSGKVINDNEQK